MKKLKTGQKKVGNRTVLKKGYKYGKGGKIVRAKSKATSRKKSCSTAGKKLNRCKN